MCAIFLVDKPKGITSFDVIRKLRVKTGIKKMGHAGTLDPAASGLLIVATEGDTKKLRELLGLPKKYYAEILLGTRTDSGDMEGKVLEEKPVPELFEKDIERALSEIKGEVALSVPVYSAIKKAGKPLYAYVRKGVPIIPPVKKMMIYGAKFIGREENALRVEFEVGSGTYIRSIAEELGRRLGTVAVLKELRRVSIGDFDVNDAIKV